MLNFYKELTTLTTLLLHSLQSKRPALALLNFRGLPSMTPRPRKLGNDNAERLFLCESIDPLDFGRPSGLVWRLNSSFDSGWISVLRLAAGMTGEIQNAERRYSSRAWVVVVLGLSDATAR